MIQLRQLDTGAADAAVDEREDATDRRGEHDDEQRKRPGNKEQREQVKEPDRRALQRRDENIDRERDTVSLNEKDIGDFTARRAIEEIEVCGVKPLEQRVAERDRYAPFQVRRQHL